MGGPAIRRGNVGPVEGRREVTTGGVRLAYDVSGAADAAPMVLLHALGDRAAAWAPVTGQFAAAFRVFAPDMRGHGDSDWPGTYSFDLMCRDVLGFLDRLGLGTVTLVGHSMGGAVAYLIAMRQPERVRRLIVEDAPPPFRRERDAPERPAQPLDFDWAVVPAIIGEVNQGDEAAWAGLTRITAPTLLVGGGPDSHIPQDKLSAVAARIPACDLVTIPVGHNVHAARPAEFADMVLSWLGG
jgi:3-oxoadipate enol-lactonase